MRPWLVLTVLGTVGAMIAAQPVARLFERSAAADPAEAQQAEERIAGIAFDGGHLPLARLRDAVSTHAGDAVATADLARDRSTVRATLVAEGYLDAVVDTAAVTHTAAGAFVWFAVRPGARYHVGRVHVVDATPGRTTVVTLLSGDDARAAAIDDARAQAGGDARVELSAHRTSATVDVTIFAR
jgi:hypothetical protein